MIALQRRAPAIRHPHLSHVEVDLADVEATREAAAQVASRQRAGGLSTLVLGRHADLAPLHARLNAWQTGVPLGLSVALLLMGGFAVALGWAHRREGTLVWFGGLCLSWGLADVRLWWREPPLSGPTMEAAQVAWMAAAKRSMVSRTRAWAGTSTLWAASRAAA